MTSAEENVDIGDQLLFCQRRGGFSFTDPFSRRVKRSGILFMRAESSIVLGDGEQRGELIILRVLATFAAEPPYIASHFIQALCRALKQMLGLMTHRTQNGKQII